MKKLSAVLAAALLSSALGAAHAATAKLSGAEETPPVTTEATGTSTITVHKDKTVTGHVMTKGVEGTMAHIHLGAMGKAGPPVVTLVKKGDHEFEVPAGTKLTDEQYDAYKAGNLYVNVHSDAHKPGEIRAQLK